MSAKRWRCFHCDEVFTTRRDAWLHFGEQNCESDVPACIDPLRHDEAARVNAVRLLREEIARMESEDNENGAAKDQLEIMHSELRQHFGDDCSCVWTAGDRYKSALNRISDLLAGRESEIRREKQ